MDVAYHKKTYQLQESFSSISPLCHENDDHDEYSHSLAFLIIENNNNKYAIIHDAKVNADNVCRLIITTAANVER